MADVEEGFEETAEVVEEQHEEQYEEVDNGPEEIWSADWRQNIAGEDAAALKRLGRFESPSAMWDSYRSLENKMSSGDFVPTLREGADDADLAAYRESLGVPTEIEGYYESFGDLEIGEDDRSRSDAFLEVAHQHNIDPLAAKAMVEWSFEHEQSINNARMEADSDLQSLSTQELMEDWGGGYKGNLSAINGFLDMFGGDGKETLMSARDENGDPIMSQPAVLRGLLSMATESNPAATLIPPNQGDGLRGVEGRRNEILDIMRTDHRRYEKSPELQKELYQLNVAHEKMSSR